MKYTENQTVNFDLSFKDALQVKYSVLQLLLRQGVRGSQLLLQSNNDAAQIRCEDDVQWYLGSIPPCSESSASFTGCLTQCIWHMYSLWSLSCSCENTVLAMLLLLHKHSASVQLIDRYAREMEFLQHPWKILWDCILHFFDGGLPVKWNKMLFLKQQR